MEKHHMDAIERERVIENYIREAERLSRMADDAARDEWGNLITRDKDGNPVRENLGRGGGR